MLVINDYVLDQLYLYLNFYRIIFYNEPNLGLLTYFGPHLMSNLMYKVEECKKIVIMSWWDLSVQFNIMFDLIMYTGFYK